MRPSTMRTTRMTVLAAVLALGLAGCGAATSARPGGGGTIVDYDPVTPLGSGTRPAPVNLVDAGYTGRFRAWATVLERGDAGPQLCVGAIATSYPPQCGGPAVAGWSWAKVQHEEAAGVRWGAYVLVGRYDGKRFTPTEPVKADDGSGPRPPEPPLPDLRSPCPPPSGGWVPVDPAKATDDALQQATAVAAQQPGYAALWLDQNEAAATGGPSATLDNDPARIVLNVSTTLDVAGMHRALRAVWGGNLCVSRGRRTDAELSRVQTALERTPGLLSSAPNTVDGWVDLTVVRATRQLQQQLDATYGPGVVRLIGALDPID